MHTTERDQLEQAIAGQEALRPALGDATVDAVIAVLKDRLADLTAQAVSEQRKLVTILFADTVASTALSSSLDPEDVLELMDGALRAYADQVTLHEGTVARLMGDGLLAFFGAPIGREDDPVRAVRCGLAILRAAADYAREVEARLGSSGFNVRVGINTGLVAVGDVGGVGGSEWTAMGDAINLAARLQGAAQSGTVLISTDTHRHITGLFETQEQPPLVVKGKTEPLTVYTVQREKPRTFRQTTRGVEGIVTKMVGRGLELKRLQDIFYYTFEESETQVVTLMGEPGVGKSRLMREFDSWLDELPMSVAFFTGRATPEMANTPYSLMRNVFAFRFGIQDSDRASAAREKFERGVMAFLGDDAASRAHYIGNLIGFDFAQSPYIQDEDPAQLTQLGIYYLTEFFGVLGRTAMTVLFLDDIHWADDRSLELINHIVRARRDLRLMILCLARPTLFERRPPLWTDKHAFHTTLELKPLTPAEIRNLVGQILSRAESIPDSLYTLVVNSADGNPFYAEELLKMLIDDGVIVKTEPHWTIEAERLTNLRIPPTLTGVLQARLDALPLAERVALQRASVVGRIFWDQILGSLHSEDEAAPINNIDSVLADLRRRELIRGRGESTFANTQEFIFKHTMLRDVTYESVLKRQRRVYHEQVANWLVERTSDRAGEYTNLIADHYEKAGQPNKAFTYLLRAGERAVSSNANTEAIALLERALELLDEVELEDRPAREGQIRLWLGTAQRGLSNYAAAISYTEEALRLFSEAQEKRGVVNALNDLGWMMGVILLHREEGAMYFQQALTMAREINDQRGIAWSLNGLGALAQWQGNPDEAIRYYEDSLEIARAVGDLVRVSGALNNIGMIQLERGEHELARARLEESLEIGQRIGRRQAITSAYMNLGNLARAQGDSTKAQQYYSDALAIYREIGDRAGTANGLYGLGVMARLAGNFTEAHTRLTESLAISREIYYPSGISNNLGEMAQVERLQGNYDDARRHLYDLLEIIRSIGDPKDEADSLIDLAVVESLLGHTAESRYLLGESLALNSAHAFSKGIARSLLYLAEADLSESNIHLAQERYAESLRIYREEHDRLGMVLALGGLASVEVDQREFEAAREHYFEAFQTASALHDQPLTLWVLTGIAELLAREGQAERSLELLGLVLSQSATPQDARARAETLLDELKPGMDADECAACLERGKGLFFGAFEVTRRSDGDTLHRWVS